MFSVKPGRGPSLMGAVGLSLFACVGLAMLVGANVLMSGAAASIKSSFGDGPVRMVWVFRIIFSLGLVVIILVTLSGAIYNFVNFRSRNRMSAVDITTGGEESDPIADALGFGKQSSDIETEAHGNPRQIPGKFCPFCGAEVEETFDFCPKCGKDI